MSFVEWVKTFTKKVTTTSTLLYQKAADAAKNVANKCKQFLHEHFAGQENIENEKTHKHLKKTFGMVKAEYQHLLQQLATAAETCLNKMQRLPNADEEQQASHVTAFDILSEFLEETMERARNTMDQINGFQAFFTDEKSKMLNQDYTQFFFESLLMLILGNLLSSSFSSLVMIPTPIGAISIAIGIAYNLMQVTHPIYSSERTRSNMQHLEEDLQGIFSKMNDMMNILDEVNSLVHNQNELLQQQESSEAKSTLENRIKYLLNELSLLEASYEEYD